jgi:hypothetical protein
MSAWAIVGLSILSILFTLIMNAALISWTISRRVAKYDAFGELVKDDHESLEKLWNHFTAHTGIANGVQYRKEKET